MKEKLQNLTGVFVIIDLNNSKLYLSHSMNQMYTRFRAHCLTSSTNIGLRNSIHTHGLENFAFAVLQIIPAFSEKTITTELKSAYEAYYDYYTSEAVEMYNTPVRTLPSLVFKEPSKITKERVLEVKEIKNPTGFEETGLTDFRYLNDKEKVTSYRKLLSKRGGIYCFINQINGKRYIGSTHNFYNRLYEHLYNSKKSNLALRKAFNKYGLDHFIFKILSDIDLTDKAVTYQDLIHLENDYISSYPFHLLYNFNKHATSMLGYKHTEATKQKMRERFINKENHPMYGKKHSEYSLSLISKPGKLNPMYGKKHKKESKALISAKLSKYPKGVGIYDLDDNLIKSFKNNVEISKYLNVGKMTVGRYMNRNIIYQNKYRFKPIKE
jgi:group I intron endonuclease